MLHPLVAPTPSPQAGIVPADETPDAGALQLARLRDPAEIALAVRLHARVAALLGRSLEMADTAAVRELVAQRFASLLTEEGAPVNRTDRVRLQDAVLDEVLGYGPIQHLLEDDTISEIMVNGPNQVWIERDGRLHLTDVTFNDADHVLRVIQRIVMPLGRRCDETSPMVDARLPDGSRVNAIIPPLSLTGPTLTVRKFRRVPFGPDDLVRMGTLTRESLDFLAACVRARLNVIVAGGSGSGKTTLLNTLSRFISPSERIVTIEDAAELQLEQTHIVRLEHRPPNAEGRGEITIRDLFRNALRMRPDRIVIGECRGAEALDMLQAMNTGHDGSLTTVHSNGPRDSLARIETMVLLSGADLPLRAIREQVAAAIDLVVYIERMQDGSRKVTQISEIRDLEGDIITMQDVFAWQGTGLDEERVRGALRPTGIRPAFAPRLVARGIPLQSVWFGYETPLHEGGR